MQPTVDPPLLTVLRQMIADQSDQEIHYLVTASHYEFNGARLHFVAVHFHQDATFNIDLAETGIECNVRSKRSRSKSDRIHIPYKQIWRISRNSEPTFESRHDVYFNEPVMRTMFDELIFEM